MSSASSRNRRLRGGLAAVPAVALAASGLLAVAPSSASAAAPEKAPNTPKLAGALAKQKLVWQTCDFGDDLLNERFATMPNVQCATVKVPRDWHNPGNGKTFDIRISQAKNQDVTSARYKGTIFVNPGGPGGEGLPWGAAMDQRTPDLKPYYNYIGFDPRGVGQSTQLGCDVTYDPNSPDPLVLEKAIGAQCSSDPDIKLINTEQTAYDMDFIRSLLKAPKLSYIGYSYGTWLGAWYENVFGANGDKFLLDSATDATQPTLQRTWDIQPKARDRQFEMHLMNWIARHNSTYKLGTDAQKIYTDYWRVSGKLNRFMLFLTWAYGGGTPAMSDNTKYPIAASIVAKIIGFEKDLDRSAAASPAVQADALLADLETSAPSPQARAEAKAGRVKLASLKKLPTLAAARKASATAEEPPMLTETFDDPFDMIRCNDGQWTQGASYWQNWVKNTAKTAPLSNQWGLVDVPVCAFWRTSNMMPVANPSTFPKTIVGQGEMDSQTAYETGFASATKLPNTSAIFIDNEGSHGHFPYGTECYDRPIYNFFLKGKQPKDVTVCQALPLVQETTTFETWGKLNNKGKETPVNGGPFTPATTAGKSAASLTLTVDDPAVESQLRKEIRKVYGKKGTDAFDRHGLSR